MLSSEFKYLTCNIYLAIMLCKRTTELGKYYIIIECMQSFKLVPEI